MSKSEHVQFLVLMIPTFLVLAAAALSMADLGLPATEPVPHAAMVAAQATPPAEPAGGDERPAE